LQELLKTLIVLPSEVTDHPEQGCGFLNTDRDTHVSLRDVVPKAAIHSSQHTIGLIIASFRDPDSVFCRDFKLHSKLTLTLHS
jgi:hypothetical protein